MIIDQSDTKGFTKPSWQQTTIICGIRIKRTTWKSLALAFGYVLTISFRISSTQSIAKPKANGGPQNIPGIGVVRKTRCKPGPYRLITAIKAVATMPIGTARFLRGPQRGLDWSKETLRFRMARRFPYCIKTIVT
jgi:hypothetical protein